MQHRALFLIALGIAAGCTYKEYNTYNDAPVGADDAGVPERVGHGGASGAGSGGDGGGAGTGGSAGSAQAGSAGSGSVAEGAGCTGCVRLSVPSSRIAEYQLEFDSRRNLSSSLVLWRVRVRDYVGDVQLIAYVESGDHRGPIDGFTPEGTLTVVQLNAASGWQDVGVDLDPVQSFQASFFTDAGGSAGAGFNPGFPFDKSRVERVGLRIAPFAQTGVFTSAVVEVDSVTFSAPPNLDVDFSADQGGFELVDSDAGTVTQVDD